MEVQERRKEEVEKGGGTEGGRSWKGGCQRRGAQSEIQMC